MQTQNTVPDGMFSALLEQAVNEAQRDLATRFSSRFDGLIAHISKSELNFAQLNFRLSRLTTFKRKPE